MKSFDKHSWVFVLTLVAYFFCFSDPVQAAPARVEEKRTSYFTVTQERETRERREFNVFSAAIDLSQTGFDIKALPIAASLDERARVEQAITPSQHLMIAGPDGFSSLDMIEGKWAEGAPNGPLASGGRWLATPQGAWSAVGFAADHRPVFATNWLADQPAQWFSLWIETAPGERRRIESVNRAPAEDSIAAFTFEFNAVRRIVSGADELVVLLAPLPQSPNSTVASTGTIATPREWLVYKIYDGDATATLEPDLLALRARGEAAEWLRERLKRNANVRTGTDAPGDWVDVREAVGLGQPLVWEGHPVSFNTIAPSARPVVADLREACGAVLAWFPRKSRLEVIWGQSILSGEPAMSRQAMTARLIGAGAQCAFEFGNTGPTPTLFVGEEWIGRISVVNGSWPVPAVLALTKQSEKRDQAPLVNLCRAESVGVEANDTVSALNPPSAVVDSRRDEQPGMDNFWMGRVEERSDDAAWLELQLRRVRHVSRIEIYHAQSAGFSSHYNTVRFRAYGRVNLSDRWSILGEFNENHDARTIIDLPQETEMRYFRLEILKPNQFEDNPNARIAEIAIWGR